jgi:hypothetical protein
MGISAALSGRIRSWLRTDSRLRHVAEEVLRGLAYVGTIHLMVPPQAWPAAKPVTSALVATRRGGHPERQAADQPLSPVERVLWAQLEDLSAPRD